MSVALTFDVEHPDRPNLAPDALERILDALAAHEARATFFLQGRWVEAHPDQARQIANAGHLVGNHSFHHATSWPTLHRADCGVGLPDRPWLTRGWAVPST